MKDAVIAEAGLRHSEEVMRLSRMGAMFPSRLSFLRSLTRRLIADKSNVSRHHWDMDAEGFGTAVHGRRAAGHSLVPICS